MGFSYGTVAAVYSSNERFRKLHSVCNVTYQDDTVTSGKPIRLFHGIVDDINSFTQCRSYVERLNKAGADVALSSAFVPCADFIASAAANARCHA
jgi:hypothetical protein